VICRSTVLVILLLSFLCAAPALAQSSPAPGAPGQKAVWTEADKEGFGSHAPGQQDLLTLDDGRLTEVYYPDLGTPALRDLQFVVSDARRGHPSATPLAWSHAQFVRLAWSIQAGRPVERPRVVACRYGNC
jgi:hypothetical protein